MRFPLLAAALVLVFAPGGLSAQLTTQEVASPAGPGAVAPQLTTSPSGEVWLSWLEPVAPDSNALKIARLGAAKSVWGPAREVARGPDWFVNWADTPQIAAGSDGRLAAVWLVNNPIAPAPTGHADHVGAGYSAHVSLSTDAGTTWSAPAPLSAESDRTEFVSLAPLPDGRWLAVWLDGRATPRGGAMRLYSRVLGSEKPDTLIDDHVCDCCATALNVFPDGSALVAYRDRSATEARDISTARWQAGRWTAPTLLNADGWHIPGCPVNGPSLAHVNAQVGAVWYTAADETPTIYAAISATAGARFGAPRRLNLKTAPSGRVAGVMLRDGRFWASWLESDGQLALRSLAGTTGGPGTLHRLPATPGGAGRNSGFPRLTVIADQPDAPIRLLVARTASAEPGAAGSQILTTILTLPPLTAAEAADCGCGPGAPTNPGATHAVRARVVSVEAALNRLHIEHQEIPGLLPAQTTVVAVSPVVAAAVAPGQRLIGRLERAPDGSWRLVSVRLLGATPQLL